MNSTAYPASIALLLVASTFASSVDHFLAPGFRTTVENVHAAAIAITRPTQPATLATVSFGFIPSGSQGAGGLVSLTSPPHGATSAFASDIFNRDRF